MVAWSYSALESFENCPFAHYRTKVKKDVQTGQTPEMAEGLRVHKALENRLLSGTALPDSYAKYEPIAARVAASANGGMLEPERKLCINEAMQPVTYFAKDAWVRVITDFTIQQPSKKRAFIGDWKTGQPKPESAQLRLSAAVTFHHLPYIDEIHNAFLWLKTGAITREVFKREDLPAIWQGFAPRVQRLDIAHQENKWPKRPSGLCNGWCPVRDCEFWKPKR